MNLRNSAHYLLAGESGGSKTVLCLLGQNGVPVYRLEIDGVAALKEGMLPVERILGNGISRLLAGAEVTCEEISHCYFSLGGPNQQEVETSLDKYLPGSTIAVGREADGTLIMTCAPFFNCMAALMAGTGSVAVGEFGGKRYFAGGWGYEFDDAGSGGRIGKEALTAFLMSVDRRGRKSGLNEIFAPLLDNIDIENFSGRMELKRKIHELDRKQIAAYAPAVYRLFQRGDAAAREIMNKTASDIAVLAAAVIPEGYDEIKVLGLGGMFKLGDEFKKMCSENLDAIHPGATFIFPDDFDLAKGACLMVIGMSGVRIDNAVLKNLLSQP